MTTPPPDPMIGRLIDGRYQVRSRIARGGMATVYLATDLRLERRVAIKIMHGHLADDNTFKTRFVQEARSAARLAHPNVVNVFDQGQDAESAYLVMEYLPGITLRDLLKDYTRLTPEQTVDIMDAVLAGLAAAHKAGIVHRDLKPENVLLADDGRIKLGDFGLARAASANTATGQALLGTIAYLSPELVTRGVADARSDLYAIGIMMYEMLTGEQPYVGEAPMQIAYQHANDSVPTPSSKQAGVPAELDELVLWATSRDPEQRPADARELLDRLREIEPLVRAPHAAPPSHATMVLTGATATATAETRVLAPTSTVAFAPDLLPPGAGDEPPADDDDAAALTAGAARRRRRGYWLFALVLLLTGLAAGTGWYFGAGPGALADVPDTHAKTVAEATALLEEAGFQVAPDERHDPEVPEGQVSGTDPAGGLQAQRGSTVRMYVSLGPRILPMPEVVGLPEAEAREQLTEFAVAEGSQPQFSAEIAAGSVIGVLDRDGAPVGAEYPERAALTLIVSAGAIPDVVGLPRAEAQAALAAVNLAMNEAGAEFDNSGDIAADAILSAQPTTDPVRPGDTIDVIVSKGQDLVAVPNVVGQRLQDAIAALEGAGFTVAHNFPAPFAPFVNVTSQEPGADARALRGSEVKLVGTLTL
ncbi:Stk1 family PASTA domain-containing Ser/Thr kinase [Agromyces aerolatus]|uniref:Stk1 family PASTA domain-containing Ser/Thr kinase n=1 Tax=Agromyces sp. LY-1074 TaxID=3074080 RepID=UPI002859A8A7|nr:MULTISPECIES: Stk1 family PASTA domain-containing Ser/Thr kinase [unclassified Agromyces]MDR5700782.1 Stk1 family PASTA domain-containing Ser/Thr kinase [Agromyces sp. LY-1074]MDR5707303.1 Stk1 family PASTA domain-containing Ser/Thr kinase [Agromyces sp. LY-1358]